MVRRGIMNNVFGSWQGGDAISMSEARLVVAPIDNRETFKDKAYTALRNVIMSSDIYRSRTDLRLDEPTNHLDLEAINALNIALQKYEGTVLLVTHDEDLLEEVGTRVWHFEHGRIVEDGNHGALMRLKGGIYRRLVERQAEGVGDELAA